MLNFIPLSTDLWSSNVLVRTITTMINHKKDEKNRNRLVKQMKIAMEKIAAQSQCMSANADKVKLFFDELEQNQLGIKSAIKWYTE